MPLFPVIAQVEIAGLEDLTALRDQLADQSLFVTVLYGSVFLIGFALLFAFTARIQNRPLAWREPLDRLVARPWTWRHAAAIIFPLITVQLLFATFFMANETPDAMSSAAAERTILLLQGVLFHGIGFLLMLGVMLRSGIRWMDGFGIRAGGLARQGFWGILILLGTMPVVIAYNLAANMIMAWWGMEPQMQDVTRIISGAAGWPEKAYFVVLALVAAPLVEEMLFRGILLPALSRLAGVRVAIVAVALLFSLVHGFYMPAFFVFFILSVSFSLAYIYRGSLWVPVVMHSLFNGLTMAVLLRL